MVYFVVISAHLSDPSPQSWYGLRAGLWRDGVRAVSGGDGVHEPLVQRARCRLLRQWVGASMGRERWDGRQLRLCCSIL